MPIFDGYVMVDWSAACSRKRNRADCLWIAYGRRSRSVPTTESPASRTEATARVRKLLTEDPGRWLVCFDFAYGYPSAFASALAATTAVASAPWLAVWNYLATHLHDDLGTTPGKRPSNRSNRFEVAEAINSALTPADGPAGPCWCTPSPARYPSIPQLKPRQPFTMSAGLHVAELRETDTNAGSDTPFRLFGTGSVGSQVLTGIPRLHSLRFDPDLDHESKVWPFETGWASDLSWLAETTRVLHAEIYPSVREPLPDTVKDRGQVRAMWQWARDLDEEDKLWLKFARPTGLSAVANARVQAEEGWILGV